MKRKGLLLALNSAPLILLAVVCIVFGVMAPRFFEAQNLGNVLVQSSSTAIVAIGMTFVLLTAGVDLSVGAVMFVAAAIAGKMAIAGAPLIVTLPAMIAIGAACGSINALFVTRFRIVPFIATLATLYLGRGFALWFTETRALNLPSAFLDIGAGRVAGIPLPIVLLAGIAFIAHVTLSRTPFGRQVYAVGHNREAARKAGIPTTRILAIVYIIAGACAAAGAIVSLSQLGAVSPTFGLQKEFSAIAAAVLGGTSLFGGRGRIFPGTLLGAILIQTVENGLVILNADPYVYPLFTAAIIFFAVLLDSIRTGVIARWSRRTIRLESDEIEALPLQKSG